MIKILIALAHFCYLCDESPPPPPTCSVDFSISPGAPVISTTPAMPSISGSVTSRTPSNATVSWSASISHTAPGTNCSGGPTFTSNTATGSGTTFTPTFSGLYGGQLTVTATCSASGYASTSRTRTATVGGTQPSDSSIVAQINSQTLPTPMDPADLRRIGCWESTGLNQFTSSKTPFYAQNGTAGDVGIMGICFQRTNRHVWDWKENIEYGRTLLVGTGNSRTQAQAWLDGRVALGAPPYGDSRWRDETLKKYNAGTCQTVACAYWDWSPTKGWIIVDRGGTPGYVSNVEGMSASCL